MTFISILGHKAVIDSVTNLQRPSHLVAAMSETSMTIQSTRSLSFSSHQGSYFQPTRSMYWQISSPITWLPTASTGLPAYSSQHWLSNLTLVRHSAVDWKPTPSFTANLTSTQQNTVSSWSTKYFTNGVSLNQYTPSDFSSMSSPSDLSSMSSPSDLSSLTSPSDLSSMSSNEYSPSPSSPRGMMSLSPSQYFSTSLLSSSTFFFFIRTSKFCLRLTVLNFFSFLRLKCS